MNPIATLHMANGKKIVIELLPESAPNTVNSFIYTASRGHLDHHAVKWIAPRNWVDVSYTAFGKKEYRYLIPNEFELNPDVEPLDSHPGSVYVGGYGGAGLAGRESPFPLRGYSNHKGIYPVFGRILGGMDEVYRLEKVETVFVTDFPIKGVKVNRPVRSETIEQVELELCGAVYPESVRVRELELPECRKDEATE